MEPQLTLQFTKQEKWPFLLEVMHNTLEQPLRIKSVNNDNTTISSSLVGYDSYCNHKTHGTSKPDFSSTKGYLP